MTWRLGQLAQDMTQDLNFHPDLDVIQTERNKEDMLVHHKIQALEIMVVNHELHVQDRNLTEIEENLTDMVISGHHILRVEVIPGHHMLTGVMILGHYMLIGAVIPDHHMHTGVTILEHHMLTGVTILEHHMLTGVTILDHHMLTGVAIKL